MNLRLGLSKFRSALNFSGSFRARLLSFLLLLLAALFLAPQAIPARASEGLRIAVAEWRQEAGPARDLQAQVYVALLERLGSLGLHDVTVIQIPESVVNAGAIDLLATEYGVDVIVWGWYDGTSVWSYVDLADATDGSGMSNSLAAFLDRGGSPDVVRVLQVLSAFDYAQDGAYFCVPRWKP